MEIAHAKLAAKVGATAAAAIGLAETDRLIGAAVNHGAASPAVPSGGSSRAVADVVGLTPTTDFARESWDLWHNLPASPEDDLRGQVVGLLGVHIFIDLLFMVAYVLLLRQVIGASAPAARWLVWVVAVTDVVEAIAMFEGRHYVASNIDDVPGSVKDWVAGAAIAKWASVALLLLAILSSREFRKMARSVIYRAARAVGVQRLSFIVVAVVATLSLVPLGDVWDQLPDVQRGWIEGLEALVWRDGLRAFVLAVLATVVVSSALFILGRRRAERAWDKYVAKKVRTEPAAFTWWLVGPVIVAAAALGLHFAGHGRLVDGQAVAMFVAVPIGLVATSWAMRTSSNDQPPGSHNRLAHLAGWVAGAFAVVVGVAAWAEFDMSSTKAGWAAGGVVVVLVALVFMRLILMMRGWRVERPEEQVERPEEQDAGQQRAMDTVVAGDVLALAVLMVSGLGLVRSFVAPVLLEFEPWPVGLLIFGGALQVATPFVLYRVTRRDGSGESAPASETVPGVLGRALNPANPGILTVSRGGKWPARIVTAVVVVPAISVLAFFVIDPIRISTWLGVVATTLAALGSWAVVLGFLIVRLQHRLPLEIFRWLRLEANPVLTIILVSLFLVSLAGGDRDLHALRPGGAALASPDHDLATEFGNWVDRSGDCKRPAAEGSTIKVRPLVLVAASGGGIRSAVWTSGVFDELRDAGNCGMNAVMMSSGVSGGSLGLVLARQGPASEKAMELAKPETLSVATAGLLVRDTVAALTGLRAPTVDSSTWRDRAALMESVWVSKVPQLDDPYTVAVSGPTGALVLNSAAAGLHCRVLVSQIRLATNEPGATQRADCHRTTGLPAASLDLHAISAQGNACAPPTLSWATAAMLSARFPTVTPAGRVSRCDGGRDLQLVDGGYAESSGVGTLAEIAPRIAELVRTHNDGNPNDLVVPILVYLEDETRAELEVPEPDLAPELLVPVAGVGAAKNMNASATWIQRASETLARPCPANADDCDDAVRALRNKVGGGTIVVAPVTEPSVDAPLGWTLSSASLDRLTDAMEDQRRNCRLIKGYGCFQKLIAALGATT